MTLPKKSQNKNTVLEKHTIPRQNTLQQHTTTHCNTILTFPICDIWEKSHKHLHDAPHYHTLSTLQCTATRRMQILSRVRIPKKHCKWPRQVTMSRRPTPQCCCSVLSCVAVCYTLQKVVYLVTEGSGVPRKCLVSQRQGSLVLYCNRSGPISWQTVSWCCSEQQYADVRCSALHEM